MEQWYIKNPTFRKWTRWSDFGIPALSPAQIVGIKEEPANEYSTFVAGNRAQRTILPRTHSNIDQYLQKPSQLAKSSLLYKSDYSVKQFDKAFHEKERVNSVY